MNHTSPPKYNATLSQTSLAVLAIAITIFSATTVWLGDDVDYQFRMRGAIWQSWGWIRSWGEFWNSQWVHYNTVNGRFVAHALVQLFNGILGQTAFAICNGLMYALFAWQIARMSGIDWKNNPGGILTVTLLLVICFITKMMPTCQIGYIWMMTLNLIWISAFFKPGKPTWIRTILLGIAGMIVGNGQECISIGICAGLGIWWLRHLIDWRRSWMMLGYLIGTATCCLSPGTLARVETVSIPMSDQLTVLIWSCTGILILVVAIGYVCLRYKPEQIREFAKERFATPNSVWLWGLIFLLIFNAIIGLYSNRQLFGANLCAIILALRVLPKHSFGKVLNGIMIAIVVCIWGIMAYGMREVKRQYDDILALHAESENGIVVYDRHRVRIGGVFMDAKYYEDILGQFDNDLHHSIMKQLKHHGRKKTLVLKPSVIPPQEQTEEYYPGHFAVTARMPASASAPRQVKVYGHRNLAGIRIPTESRLLEITKYSRLMPPYGVAVIVPEYPAFVTDSVILLPLH